MNFQNIVFPPVRPSWALGLWSPGRRERFASQRVGGTRDDAKRIRDGADCKLAAEAATTLGVNNQTLGPERYTGS